MEHVWRHVVSNAVRWISVVGFFKRCTQRTTRIQLVALVGCTSSTKHQHDFDRRRGVVIPIADATLAAAILFKAMIQSIFQYIKKLQAQFL
jgi:hypothetical protein